MHNMELDSIIRNPTYSSLMRQDTGKRFDLLVETIKSEGIREPLIVNQHNELIDGYHRYRAAQQLGLTEVPTTTISFNSPNEAKLWMIKNQASRRNLTPDDRKQLIPHFQELLKVKYGSNSEIGSNEPKYTNDLIAEVLGVSKPTIVRDKAEIRKVEQKLQQANVDVSKMDWQQKKEAAHTITAKEVEVRDAGKATIQKAISLETPLQVDKPQPDYKPLIDSKQQVTMKISTGKNNLKKLVNELLALGMNKDQIQDALLNLVVEVTT